MAREVASISSLKQMPIWRPFTLLAVLRVGGGVSWASAGLGRASRLTARRARKLPQENLRTGAVRGVSRLWETAPAGGLRWETHMNGAKIPVFAPDANSSPFGRLRGAFTHCPRA